MQPVADRDVELFRRGISPTSKCLIGLSVACALVALDGRRQWAETARAELQRGLAPIQQLAALPWRSGEQSLQYLTLQQDLLRRVDQLEAENDRLRIEARNIDLLQQENSVLRQLQDLPTEGLALRRAVQLVQRGRDGASQRFLINAGSLEGLRPGLALVAPDGVVGQVIAVDAHSAQVALLSDQGQATPVQIARNSLRAVLVGEGLPNRASLRFLANNADVKPGDQLLTSGLDGVYPPGMPVATVLTVERDSQSDFAIVACRPSAATETRRHFVVVEPSAPAPADGPAP
jgi:rod shape-determining protein MreC